MHSCNLFVAFVPQPSVTFSLSSNADGFTTKEDWFGLSICQCQLGTRVGRLDSYKIESNLSETAFTVVTAVIYCSAVPKLCLALLGTLPFTLIGLATNCDRSHCWQIETLETPVTASSHLDPIYFEVFSFSHEQMCIASWADTQKGLHWQLKIHRFASLCNALCTWC